MKSRRDVLTLLFVCVVLVVPGVVRAQNIEPTEVHMRAKVVSLSAEEDADAYGFDRTVQTAVLRILTGEEKGKEITLENAILNDREDMRLKEGEVVVLQRILNTSGEVQYFIRDKYRIPSLLLLIGAFFVLAVLFGGWMGFTSILGLGVSILVLMFLVVPAIVSGWNPLLVSLSGAISIAMISLYLAHGFNRRTTIALISTILTLAISVLIAMLFVSFAKLFGMGSEETIFLQLGPLEDINLRGLLLGGIIIGALGVLDDITTAQTAAIDELSRANPKMDFRALYASGISIGREHIASLINTLALAYVGASLPLLLLFSMNRDSPIWVILNSEFIAEEIVRTLVGSVTLLLAVPLSTYFAARAFQKGAFTTSRAHSH